MAKYLDPKADVTFKKVFGGAYRVRPDCHSKLPQ